jgi:hypothetical protein
MENLYIHPDMDVAGSWVISVMDREGAYNRCDLCGQSHPYRIVEVDGVRTCPWCRETNAAVPAERGEVTCHCCGSVYETAAYFRRCPVCSNLTCPYCYFGVMCCDCDKEKNPDDNDEPGVVCHGCGCVFVSAVSFKPCSDCSGLVCSSCHADGNTDRRSGCVT